MGIFNRICFCNGSGGKAAKFCYERGDSYLRPHTYRIYRMVCVRSSNGVDVYPWSYESIGMFWDRAGLNKPENTVEAATGGFESIQVEPEEAAKRHILKLLLMQVRTNQPIAAIELVAPTR